MKLSTPIYRLKRQARLLSRQDGIPLHAALDRIAVQEGFRTWSHLAAKFAEASPAAKLLTLLHPGDLALLAARPGHGKTLLALELAMEAAKMGRHSHFFTLESTEEECRQRLRSLGWNDLTRFECDASDAIDASYIVSRLGCPEPGSIAIVDFLQILDQRRESPPLMEQVRTLKAFARERGVIIAFISQIDRSYDPAVKPLPDLGDIRLPNPLDLKLFDRACFLNNGLAEIIGTS